MVFYCKYCPYYCSSWKVHMRHTFECHSSTPNFLYPCEVSGCTQTFKTFSAISSHLQRRHPCDWTQLEGGTGCDTGNGSGQAGALLHCDEDDFSEEVIATNSHLLAQKSTALLLLTLKERHRLTQTAVNFSVGQIKQMFLHVLDDVKASVKGRLGNSEVDIAECFDVDPFRGLDTEYLQTKFYREHFNLVVSLHIKHLK